MRLNDFINDPITSESKGSTIRNSAIFIFVILAIYILKLFSMQIIGGEEYRNQSKRNFQRVSEIPAQRGEIFDRNATQPLAINTDSFAVDITPGEIPKEKYDTVTARLAAFLGISKNQVDRKVNSVGKRSFSSVEVKANVSFNTISQIAENIVDLPGVSWRSKPIRSYQDIGTLSHIIGYVGDISTDELKVMYNEGYTSTSVIGKAGIEKEYDKELQGKAGRESRVVDVRGRKTEEETKIEPPVPGKNLVLTIDRNIQLLAEKALGERIGSAVVLKPSTGEILAMASWPYFDTNLFSSESAYRRALNDPKNPFLNRAVDATYPPASTFKSIMSTAILQEKVLDPNKKIDCNGFIDYGNRVFKCHIGVPGHGKMDLKNGLAQSCNVYFWTAGIELGVERIVSYAHSFGYGESLEIDLPSQKTSFVPDPRWKERRFHEKWLGGDTLNMSIGQSYTEVTPLHVADMMAMFVNKGVIYKPHLLKQIRDPATNEIEKEIEREVLHKADFSPEVWTEMQQNLRYMVTNGSAQYPLNNKIVKIAGKTGTAEISNYKKQWHSWFVGYAPFDGAPEDAVVVCVSVEAANTWEWWAPYASNIIFQGIFANQTYEEAIETLGFKYLAKPMGRQE